jgi:type II secretory pathway component GspD/PulD (secretin)
MTRFPLHGRRAALALAVLASCARCAFAQYEGVKIEVDTKGSATPPVTLSARDLDVKDVLSLLSRSRGLNIVCAADVTGPITIELHEVAFDDALRAVSAIAGLEITRKGDLYYVRKPDQGDPAIDIMLEARTFRLDYLEAPDVVTVLTPLLSAHGTATSYARARAIVVEDWPGVLDRVGTVIASIDRPPRQVLIEAQVLEARLSRNYRFGVDWSLLASSGDGSGQVSVDGFASPGPEKIYAFWNQGDFTSALEASDAVDELQSLATPRLLVTDGDEARIIIGDQLGFSVVSTVDNTVIQNVEFLDVGTKLIVKPTISSDGYLQLDIHPELSNGVIQNGLPSKSTSEVTTRVLVKDGQSLVIGGLIRERDERSRKGIPLLIDIPLIGPLFGRTTKQKIRSELITVITPHIVGPGQPAPYEPSGLVDIER